jgi:hypothetical protein
VETLHGLYQHGRFVTSSSKECLYSERCTTHKVDVVPVAIWLDCWFGNKDVLETSAAFRALKIHSNQVKPLQKRNTILTFESSLLDK